MIYLTWDRAIGYMEARIRGEVIGVKKYGGF